MCFWKVCLVLIDKEYRIEIYYLALKDHFFESARFKAEVSQRSTRKLFIEQKTSKDFFPLVLTWQDEICREHIQESGDLSFQAGWLCPAVVCDKRIAPERYPSVAVFLHTVFSIFKILTKPIKIMLFLSPLVKKSQV